MAHRVRSALPLVFLATLTAACTAQPLRVAEKQRDEVIIATGGTGGVYFPFGNALADIYSTRMAVHATAEATVASVFNVEAIEQRKAHLAFVQGDVAYFAFKRGTETNLAPHTHLRAMAVLFQNVVQIVVRRDSDIQRVSQFRGKRVGVGSAGSGTEEAARIIVEGHGLNYAELRPNFLSFSEIAEAMEARTLDGGFIVANYPVSAILEVNQSVGVRLVPIEDAVLNRIRARYPFFKRIVIPKGTYRNQNEPITTIAVDNLLVCRDDMPEQLVHDLTKTLFDSLPALGRTHVAATVIDPALGPTTSIPLHPGAARYYRERELLQ